MILLRRCGRTSCLPTATSQILGHMGPWAWKSSRNGSSPELGSRCQHALPSLGCCPVYSQPKTSCPASMQPCTLAEHGG
jgi:hypothetical protein